MSLSAYEIQVLLGTTVSGCNMSLDRVFDLQAAWAHLHDLGLIDRTDGLAIATPDGLLAIEAALSALDTPPLAAQDGETIEPNERLKLHRKIMGMIRDKQRYAGVMIDGRELHVIAEALLERAIEVERSTPPSQAIDAGDGEAVVLYGPFGWLNGNRGLSEDSWGLEMDPLENNEEYFAIPLFAKVDPFVEVGKAISALTHPAAGRVSVSDELVEALYKRLYPFLRPFIDDQAKDEIRASLSSLGGGE